MIVCIFGLSCVGKTTVARRVAAGLGLPLRSCGEEVRAVAEVLRLSTQDLPDAAHREVDAATVKWALDHGNGCILEGRFLDAVFAGTDIPITLIELTAGRFNRLDRARGRNGHSTFSIEDLDRLDINDAAFRRRIFGQNGTTNPWRVLDTSNLAVDECTRKLQELVESTDLRSGAQRA